MNARSQMQRVVHGRESAGLMAAVSSLAGGFRRVLDAHARHRAMERLEKLSAAQLRDIGIRRDLIPLIVEAAFAARRDPATGDEAAPEPADTLADALDR